MKNVFKVLALLLVVAFTTPTFAQKPAKKVEPKKETSVKLKADGTPDKRFKENKKEEVKLKKDGTPDKRFKGNK
ncbi:MAG: hypothetical protein ACOYMA_02640 [Bacteroidia bacterium]